MLLNYFKLTLRLLIRNPFTTFIHVAGLAAGFATFMILWPYAEYELRSDQYHKDADRIARLSVDFKWTDNGQNWNGMLGVFNSWGVARQVANTFPNVEDVVRMVPQLNFTEQLHGLDNHFFISVHDLSGNKTTYRETQAVLADPNLFQFFSIPLVAGDAHHVLEVPNSIVISETVSKKYFGEANALGKTVYTNDDVALEVTGVFKKLPQNSHLRFDMVLSVTGKQGIDVAVWSGWSGYCYLKLKEGYSCKMLQEDLDERKASLFAFVKSGCSHCDWSPLIQPLKDIVFTDFRGNTFASKSKFLLEAVYVVSFVILMLGWINYIALSVHSLKKRLSEWATRKVVGAGKKDISIQLLVESLTINTISLVAALTIFQTLKTPAEQWLGVYIPKQDELSLGVILVIVLVFLTSITLTSLSPLLFIQKRGIIELLKGSGSRAKSSPLKSGLVTAQYVIAVVLLIWVTTTSLQLNHILEKDIGLRKDGILVIEGPARSQGYNGSELSSFVAGVQRIDGVIESAVSHSLVGEPDVKGTTVYRKGGGNFVGTDTNGGVDENFLSTFQIDLLVGRNFLPDNPADKNTVLISQALARRLGFATIEEAIGEKISLLDSKAENVEIIGVFSDYEFRPYFNDMTERGRGILLTYKNYLIPFFKPLKISVNVDMQKVPVILAQLEALHSTFFPDETFRWYWLEEKIGNQYSNERIAKNQIAFFTLLAIGIACLGLLGMITNKVVEKTKEIGIRKVLGAQLHQVVHVLLNSTVKQVVLAVIVGIPVSYYLTQRYLENFSDRVAVAWWHFTVPILIIIVIMSCTIASAVWRAANGNPVEALKHE